MDFDEVVLESRKSLETDQMVDKSVQGKFSKTVIGEDLRRAIVALRSVPKVNWSQDLNYEDNTDGYASTEYIWRATDLSGGSSSFEADWQTAIRFNDSNQRRFPTNNGTPKLAASQMQNHSEIMRKDSFTLASKRLDRTSDSKCQLLEQSTTSVQMSLFSREKQGKANGIGEKSYISVPGELTGHKSGAKVPGKPPLLPPKPSHLHNFKITQPVTGRLALDGRRIFGGAKNLRKTDTSLNGARHDAADIYERSLDVLEKDDSDQEFEDLVSPRSDSPECLLEELLDSVPAEEFDALECHTTPSVFIAKDKGTTNPGLSSFDNSGQKSNKPEKQDAEEVRKKQKEGHAPNVQLTSSAETESSSRTKPFTQHPDNPSLKPVYTHTKPVTRQLDFNAMKKIHRPQTEVCFKSSTLASEPHNFSLETTTSEKELTPEDIFEKIMDLLETRKNDRRKSSDNKEQKHLQHDPGNRSACDYLLENEWLSIYCDQIQPDSRHKLITQNTISERSSNTIDTESSKSSRVEAVVKFKQISEPLPGPNAELPSPDGKTHQSPTALLSPDRKFLQCPTGLTSPDIKGLQGPKSLPSSCGKVLQGSNSRLLSPDGKVTITSQDTLEATVKRKPVPPLRGTVRTYTFVKNDSLLQDIKIAPTFKPQQSTQTKDTMTFSNSLTAGSSLNSRAEFKYEPVTVVTGSCLNRLCENSESRRATGVSSEETNVLPSCEENKKTNTRRGEIITKPEALLSKDYNTSPPTDIIVATITRESDLPGCELYEEEMDLDLDIELSRNLDACTASDVECQSIDQLVTSESLLSSDTKVIRRPKKSSSLDVKVPGKISELLAKKKLKKSQSIDNTGDVVWSHRNERVNSKQVNIQEIKTISTHGEGSHTAQETGHNLPVKEFPEFADKHSKELNNFETTRRTSPGYTNDSALFRYEPSPAESLTDDRREGNVVADSSDSENEDSYKETMKRNVRSVAKENTTGLEKQQSIQVLSEEVTCQEIVLKIAWPKHQSRDESKITETTKPPFRKLQLQRVTRISNLDNPLNVFPKLDTSKPLLAVTQQSSNALHPELTAPSLSAHEPNDGMGATLKSRVDQTVATRNRPTGITVEYANQTNCRKQEHISDSAIDVQQTDTVKVLRVPMAVVHKVQDIKDAVAVVGRTILDDLQRQPKKRNVRVTCEAVESKSRASLHDQDVTVIRNTIVDTYGPKPAIVFASGPTSSVRI